MLERLRKFVGQVTPRRLAIGAVGTVVVLVGLALMPLPGPGTLIVVLGLSILATEFEAARRARRWLQQRGRAVWDRWRYSFHRSRRAQRRSGEPRHDPTRIGPS